MHWPCLYIGLSLVLGAAAAWSGQQSAEGGGWFTARLLLWSTCWPVLAVWLLWSAWQIPDLEEL